MLLLELRWQPRKSRSNWLVERGIVHADVSAATTVATYTGGGGGTRRVSWIWQSAGLRYRKQVIGYRSHRGFPSDRRLNHGFVRYESQRRGGATASVLEGVHEQPATLGSGGLRLLQRDEQNRQGANLDGETLRS